MFGSNGNAHRGKFLTLKKQQAFGLFGCRLSRLPIILEWDYSKHYEY
jgi:hypothetical protein